MSTAPVTAIIVGAGHRALVYASYAKERPDELQIVEIADMCQREYLRYTEINQRRKKNMEVVSNRSARISCAAEKGMWNVAFLRDGMPGFNGICSYVDIGGTRIRADDPGLKRTLAVLPLHDLLGKGKQLILTAVSKDLMIEIKTAFRIYDELESVVVCTRVRNLSSAASVEIGRVAPFFIEASPSAACLDLGGDFDDYKIYIDSGNSVRALVRNLNYDPLARRYEREMCNTAQQDWVEADNQHRSMGVCAIFNPKTAKGFVISFLTFDKSRVEIKVEYSQKRLEWIAAEGDFANYELRPGQEIQSDLLWISDAQNPLLSLEEYGSAVKEYNHIKIKAIPVGWCSWYPKSFRDNISEEKVLSNARVIKKHFPGFGIRWIQIDYGWFKKNLPGEYDRTNERFPHGMKCLGRKLAKLGFEMGLWFCPSVVTEHSTIFRKRQDCVLHDRQGRPAPRHLSPWSWKPHGLTYDLDPTHPVVKKFLKRIFRRAASVWGVTYFKNDFLEQVSRRFVEHRDKKVARGIETYRLLLKIIRDSVGQKSFIFGCSNLSNGSLGLIDSNKTALDIGVGDEHRCPFKPYGHLRTTITTIASRWFQHGNFWINDPDVLVFEGSNLEEAKIRATVVALSGGTLMLGDDMRKVVRNKKLVALYKICLPPYGKAARPVDLFEKDYPRIWDLPIEKDFGAWHVTAVTSFEKVTEEIVVDFAKLGLDVTKEYLVWEFWRKQFLGKRRNNIRVKIKGAATRLLLIKEAPESPDLLSTDLHVTQGAVEIVKLRWDESKKELSGTVQRPVGTRGHLFIYVPSAYRARQACVNRRPVVPRPVVAEVLEVGLKFSVKELAWNIVFAKSEKDG